MVCAFPRSSSATDTPTAMIAVMKDGERPLLLMLMLWLLLLLLLLILTLSGATPSTIRTQLRLATTATALSQIASAARMEP